MYECDIADKLSNKHYQSVVSEWRNPNRGNTIDAVLRTQILNTKSKILNKYKI